MSGPAPLIDTLSSSNRRQKMRLLKGIWPAIPLLLLLLLAILRPAMVLDVGWLIRCWALLALPVFVILVFPLFSSQRTSSFYLGLLTHTLIYLICLLGTWITGITADVQIAGIFPFSDAAGYLQDAI